MAFLFISPQEFQTELMARYGSSVSAATFRCPTTHVRTDEGRRMHEWMIEIGAAPDFAPIQRWIGGDDEIAIMGFGHDYNIVREALPEDRRLALDMFYGPIRTATFRPKTLECADFDGAILKALGVDYAFTPKQCWDMREIGYYDPFVSHFAIAYRTQPPSGSWRLQELVENRDFRNLMGRYDALTHVLRAAYHFGSHSGTGKHLLTTYHW